MTELKRYHIKYIRDFIKKDYKARECCYICGSTETLELHHLYCVSELFHTWCAENKIGTINTVDEIMRLRVLFAKDKEVELASDNLYTLCKEHHMRLHSLYGKSYPVNFYSKVLNWINIQKDKHG